MPEIDENIKLMLSLKNGDIGALEELIKINQNNLLNFFYFLGAKKDISEDLAQETFMKVYNYRDKYEPKAKFTTFLFRIAKNTAIDYFRKEKSRPHLINEEFGLHVGHTKNGTEQQNLSMDLEIALNKLSEKLKPVVVLSFFQGFKYQDISEILEIPEGTVKSRMNLALKKLKEILSDKED